MAERNSIPTSDGNGQICSPISSAGREACKKNDDIPSERKLPPSGSDDLTSNAHVGNVDKQISSRLLSEMTSCAKNNFARLLLEATGQEAALEGKNSVEYASVPPLMKTYMNSLSFKTLNNPENRVDKTLAQCLASPSQFGADDSAPIHKLPNETLDYIFSFLDIEDRIQTELVCRHWRWMGKNLPWTWPSKIAFQNYLKFDALSRCQNGLIIHSILSRCGVSLTEVEMSCEYIAPEDSVEATVKLMKMIGDYCPNLTTVTFVGFTKFVNPHIQRFAKGCPQLKSITLDDYYGLCEGDVCCFVKHCQSLEFLDISDSSKISGQCFKEISKNLKVLRLGTCSLLQPEALESLMARCKSIQELRLLFCSQLPQALLFKVFYYYKNELKILYLDGYVAERPQHSVNWGGLRFLTALEELSLTACDGVDDDLLQCVSKKCVNLRLLSVGGSIITDRGLVQLAALPKLSVLNISNTRNVKGDGLQALAAQGHLEELYATHNAMTTPDESFSHLAWCCPNFCILDVQGTKRVSNELVAAFLAALQRQVLKSRVLLVVGGTSVTSDVEVCDGLEITCGDMSGWESVASDDETSNTDDGNSYGYDKHGYDKFGFYNYHFENYYDQEA